MPDPQDQPPPPPWERQPGEPDRAFAAFCCYRDAGARRSLDAVGRQLYEGQVGRRRGTTGRLQEWSSAWRWVERARAWDAELDRQAREAELEAVREMRRRHAEEAREFQTRALERLRSLPLEELGAPEVLRFFVEAAKLERLSRGEADGRYEHDHEHRHTGAVRLSYEELRRLPLEELVRLHRQALGLSGPN
jgi:hypothetical protein